MLEGLTRALGEGVCWAQSRSRMSAERCRKRCSDKRSGARGALQRGAPAKRKEG